MGASKALVLGLGLVLLVAGSAVARELQDENNGQRNYGNKGNAYGRNWSMEKNNNGNHYGWGNQKNDYDWSMKKNNNGNHYGWEKKNQNDYDYSWKKPNYEPQYKKVHNFKKEVEVKKVEVPIIKKVVVPKPVVVPVPVVKKVPVISPVVVKKVVIPECEDGAFKACCAEGGVGPVEPGDVCKFIVKTPDCYDSCYSAWKDDGYEDAKVQKCVCPKPKVVIVKKIEAPVVKKGIVRPHCKPTCSVVTTECPSDCFDP